MELKFSNDYNLLNIALGPHKLTYDLDVLDLPEHLGLDNPLAEMTPMVIYISLYITCVFFYSLAIIQ